MSGFRNHFLLLLVIVLFLITPVTASASFVANVTSGVAPMAVQFTDTSPDAHNGWFWNFDTFAIHGLANSTLQNPVHVYTSPGTYSIGLIIYNGGVEVSSGSVFNYITVYPGYNQTTAGFSIIIGEGNITPVNIGFNVNNIHDNATWWNWSFGDGSWQNGTTQNVVHRYYRAGSYIVTEYANNPLYTSSVSSVGGPPWFLYSKMDISYYNTTDSTIWPLDSMNATKGELLIFNASLPSVTDYSWDFGDGFGGSGANTTHRYTFGKGVSLMLTNGWTKVTVKSNASDGATVYRDSRVINLTTAMEDIHFVGPTDTIAPLNESYANAFIAVIGGNRSAPAGWTGIDWLGGLVATQNVYVSVLGFTVFYMLVFSLPFIMQWIISKDFVVAGVLGSFLGLWIIVRLPANMKLLAVAFIALSVVAIIYSLLKER